MFSFYIFFAMNYHLVIKNHVNIFNTKTAGSLFIDKHCDSKQRSTLHQVI